ncbi:MAG: diguanylate cyclase [Deltaproteobacteria bacterium]|nr:diguanylate cyclase [Deltaproteobacteria bacterium]MBW2416335.1 diguanylate cyclase [Deltaproteobacteria bacterium]
MNRSPVTRISLGLVFVTCSILVTLDLLGFTPRQADALVESRVRLCEQLAAQAAASADRNDLASIRVSLQVAVRRNDDVISAALRSAGGRLLVAAGDHRMHWDPDPEERSRATHAEVPIYKGGEPWGALEVRFARGSNAGWLSEFWARPIVRLLLVVAITCFIAFMIYLRRTLKYLDPSAVIPTRVQAALDVMAEGVLLLDQKSHIVLANSTFAEWAHSTQVALLGKPASSLDWRDAVSGAVLADFPWMESIRESKPRTRAPLLLATGPDELRSVMVNVAPVLDGWGRAKGAIATFDDVTELEQKGAALELAMKELQASQEEIRLQNEELQVLVKRDPLTGVSNRRSFLETFDHHFDVARREGHEVCCIMVDIDHFKNVNDSYGHATGDVVIRSMAAALQGAVPSVEQVCRYGGEEFVLLLLDCAVDQALEVAERLRRQVEKTDFSSVPVTASFGVSSITFGAKNPSELINEADEALYVSKETGRNKVTRWTRGQGTAG